MMQHLGYALAAYWIMLSLMFVLYRKSSRYRANFTSLINNLMNSSYQVIFVWSLMFVGIWMKNDNFMEFLIHCAVAMMYMQSAIILVLIFYGLNAEKGKL